MIKGEKIILIDRIEKGRDSFNAPIYEEKEIEVEDVLIGNPSAEDIVNDVSLYGKHISLVLGIPKGDKNNWKDKEVIIRGERYRTYAKPLTQTEANVPTKWNTQVKVEKYG